MRSPVPAQCHGKNLFYFFGAGEDAVVMHVHFGMSGAFRTSLPGQEPDARETTRLKLVAPDVVAQLSAMTVAHGGLGASHLVSRCLCWEVNWAVSRQASQFVEEPSAAYASVAVACCWSAIERALQAHGIVTYMQVQLQCLSTRAATCL